MEYNYGTQDVILAGSGDYILCKGDYVYYGYSIEGLLESANSHGRNTDCFGILVGSKKNMFSIQVRDIDGLEQVMEAPAIIFLKEDVIERYEPFSSKEDFIQSYLDHVPNDGLMSELCGEYLLRPSEAGNNLMMVLAIKDSGLSFIDDMDVSWESVKNNYRFLDGSTCGKKVRLEEFSTQRESEEITSDSTNQNTNIRNPKNIKNDDNALTNVKESHTSQDTDECKAFEIPSDAESDEKNVINIFYSPYVKEEGVEKYFREIPMYVNSDKTYPRPGTTGFQISEPIVWTC